MWSIVTPCKAVPPLEAIHAAMLDPLAATLSATGRDVAREGTSDLVIRAAGRAKKISGNALYAKSCGITFLLRI